MSNIHGSRIVQLTAHTHCALFGAENYNRMITFFSWINARPRFWHVKIRRAPFSGDMKSSSTLKRKETDQCWNAISEIIVIIFVITRLLLCLQLYSYIIRVLCVTNVNMQMWPVRRSKHGSALRTRHVTRCSTLQQLAPKLQSVRGVKLTFFQRINSVKMGTMLCCGGRRSIWRRVCQPAVAAASKLGRSHVQTCCHCSIRRLSTFFDLHRWEGS